MKELERMEFADILNEKRFRLERGTYDWRGEVIENKLICDTQIFSCDFTNAFFSNCTIHCVRFKDCITDNMVFDSCRLEKIDFWKCTSKGYKRYIPKNIIGLPEVPFVPALEERIYQAIQNAESKGDKPALNMGAWHTTYFDHEQNACGTAHCLAGWAIHLAGKEGYKLEEVFGAEEAGILIYRKSCGFVPDFFVISVDALRDLEKRLGITVPKDQK